jgi:hypothetical protein
VLCEGKRWFDELDIGPLGELELWARTPGRASCHVMRGGRGAHITAQALRFPERGYMVQDGRTSRRASQRVEEVLVMVLLTAGLASTACT